VVAPTYQAFADERLNSVLDRMLGPHNDLKVAALPLEAEKVRVIPTPGAFLEGLKEGVAKAQHRITLASLYLGTGEEAIELVEMVRRACAERPQLQVHFLVDCMRGHRLTLEGTSSVLLLRTMLAELPDQVRVSLFHTPALRGLWKWVLPDRWNEIAGVQHMKAYIFDDDVIVSGANLSKSYFTDRTDRYTLLRDSPTVTDYFDRLVDTVATFSYALSADGELHLPPGCPDPVDRPLPFTRYAKDRVDIFSYRESVHTRKLLSTPAAETGIDTWAFPTVQAGSLRVHQDEDLMHRFFRNPLDGSELSIISPYFNFTKGYANELLHNRGQVSILTAPPKVGLLLCIALLLLSFRLSCVYVCVCGCVCVFVLCVFLNLIGIV
jgi:CDP-diacylglycerol---glycerol-3-phosphate 3-phosphatidyltransferase